MKPSSKFAVAAVALLLMGQGCALTVGKKKPPGPPSGGMWATLDRGNAWQQVTLVMDSGVVGTNNEVDVVTAKFDPQDPNAIYMGTKANGLYYSYDAGRSWQQPKDIKSGLVSSVAIHPKNKCTIYSALGSRLYVSDDCNRSYRPTNFTSLIESREALKVIALDWYNPRVIYAAAEGGTLFKSLDSGNSWAVTHRFDDRVNSLVMDPRDSRILFAGTDGTGMWKSSDNGAHWASLRDLTKDIQGSQNIRAVAVDTKREGRYVVATQSGIMETLDRGGTWRSLPLLTPPGAVQITAVALDPNDASAKTIYYATDKVFYRSFSAGANWETVGLPTARAAGVILVYPEDSSVIYLGAKNL